MRNLLGRLHARRLPELLRIADAWGVPVHAEGKDEAVGALYRVMIDPRAMRDLWQRLDRAERSVAVAMADAPEPAAAPTVQELATRLGVTETAARETALRLYRAGILAREGDDEPLPIGVAPRLIMPRELAFQIRRVQDEMAAGDLTQSPLRVLIELLDDTELEAAARIWGLRTLPGVANRRDLSNRLLRVINDPGRVDRVLQTRGPDAAAIWQAALEAPGVVLLADVVAKAGLRGEDVTSVDRRRAALAELESALLVWHAYREGERWLFVPPEIRTPGEAPAEELPLLARTDVSPNLSRPWHHPDAVAWDLLTLLRIVGDAHAPTWEAQETPPRWLRRATATRFWFRTQEGPPTGYLELLQAMGLAEGVLAIDDDARPRRIVTGPQARAWRRRPFPALTTRLRDRWLRLPRWVEGEPASIVDVWGADWRGFRPRLLFALADAEIGWQPGQWVTEDSLALRIAARFPALLGPSFTAATARLAGEAGAGADERAARTAALGDVIAFELSGPFVWFGSTEIADAVGQPRAVCLTATGAALVARRPPAHEADAGAALPPLAIDSAGEITLRVPSPDRVWALSSFSEPVDLGYESHYRLTAASISGALAAGIERDQIAGFLERNSRQPLPEEVAANLAAWARGYHRVRLRRAAVVSLDDPADRPLLLHTLHEEGWAAEPLGDQALLVLYPAGQATPESDERLVAALRAAGHAPQWMTPRDDSDGVSSPRAKLEGQAVLPGDD